MPRLLYVVGSPRGATSRSNTVASAYVEAFREKHPGFEIDTAPFKDRFRPGMITVKLPGAATAAG